MTYVNVNPTTPPGGGGGGGDTDVDKSGVIAAGSFVGNPKKAAVTFASAYANNNYSVTVTGSDDRNWTIESRTAAGFVVNTNANTAPVSQLFWDAMPYRS